jgi:hypothetical protein
MSVSLEIQQVISGELTKLKWFLQIIRDLTDWHASDVQQKPL